MSFGRDVKEQAFIACGRFCCLCHKYCGTKMEVHHIKPQKEQGVDTFENAIPLCFDCHADMAEESTGHYKGNRFTENELKAHRDNWYKKIEQGVGILATPVEIVDINANGAENRKNISSGIVELDKKHITTPGSIILIAGKSKVGKSALAKSFVLKNKESDCLYFSLKEGTSSFLIQLICGEALVEENAIANGSITEDMKKRIAYEIENLKSLKIKFEDFGITNNFAQQILYTLKTEDKDVYIIDDINGLCIDEQQTEELMYKIKQIQQRTNSIVIILYNIKRELINVDPSCIPEAIYRFTDVAYFMKESEDEISTTTNVELYINHENKPKAQADIAVVYGKVINVEKMINEV